MFIRPDYRFPRVTDITPDFLKERRIRGLLLDVDNTLARDHGQTPLQGVEDWLAAMRGSGVALTVVSNAASSRLEPLAGKLGLRYISRAVKPLPVGYLRGARRLGLPRRELAAVGDQLFTDIMGANLAGVVSILVEPEALETGWSFKARRALERKILGERRVRE